MKSLAWLVLFFVAANAVGSAVCLLGAAAAHGLRSPGSGALDVGAWLLLLLGVDSVFGGPILIAAAAAIVRRWFGRLSGFSAGLVAFIVVTVLGLVAGRLGLEIGAMLGFAKFLGAVLLARSSFFRRKALELSPLPRFHGLSGTYAISLERGESPAVALGRRAAAERRWFLRRARPPERWDLSFSSFGQPHREATRGLRTALFANRDALVAWGAFPMGTLAGLGCVHLWRLAKGDRSHSTPLTLGTVILLLLSLSLLRFGALRLHERVRLLRLLREGEVVRAVRSSEQMFDQRGAIVTVGETQAGPIVVATPAPLVAGDVQGLLVGKNGDVVAWDLLPFTPAVDGRGAITVT